MTHDRDEELHIIHTSFWITFWDSVRNNGMYHQWVQDTKCELVSSGTFDKLLEALVTQAHEHLDPVALYNHVRIAAHIVDHSVREGWDMSVTVPYDDLLRIWTEWEMITSDLVERATPISGIVLGFDSQN